MSFNAPSQQNGSAKANGIHKSKPKSTVDHPLDPLTEDEMALASQALRIHGTQKEGMKAIRFQSVTLLEPPKEKVLAALGIPTTPLEFGASPPKPSGEKIPRQAYACMIDPSSGRAFEGSATIDGEKVVVDRFESLAEGVQPSISVAELLDAEVIVKNDPTVKKLCAEIGLEMDNVCCDGWSIGHDPRWPKSQRIQQCMMFGRPYGPDSNLYAHPLDMMPVVDVITRKLIRMDWVRPRLEGVTKSTKPTSADGGQEPEGWKRTGYPDTPSEYLPEFLEKERGGLKLRDDLKPIHITQPEGVSFTINGNRIHWQKFDMHIGFNYREGLVLNTVTYMDTDVGPGVVPTLRPLFYRMSIAEMVVPYGDPGFPSHRKMAFDVGEYGLGMMVNSLELGCDCKGSIAYLDVNLHSITGSGESMTLRNAICIHEEDAGLSWKHTDYRTGRAHAVRMRKLVVSCVCTLANYEYAFYFNFFQDGTVQKEIKLTGIVNTTHLSEGEKPGGFGTEVAPRVNAHYHQHIFCLRVDPMIDGVKNSVEQSDIALVDAKTGSEENFLGNGWTSKTQIFEKAGGVDWNVESGRSWSIINPSRPHYCSDNPAGYKIMCKDFTRLFAARDSIVSNRAPFTHHNIWVVPSSDDKRYPAGLHVPQSTRSHDGIDEWVAKGGSVKNEDVIVYITFGVNHVPRPEDFPVMPVEVVSVSLKPTSFFRRNPALDVPAEKDEKSVHATLYTEGAVNGDCCS